MGIGANYVYHLHVFYLLLYWFWSESNLCTLADIESAYACIDNLLTEGRLDEKSVINMEDVRLSLLVYTQMFDHSSISCQKLLDVLTPPFLKLSKHLNAVAAQPSADRDFAEKAYTCWANTVLVNLGFGGPSVFSCLRPAKLGELQNAMFNSDGFPEVRSCQHTP